MNGHVEFSTSGSTGKAKTIVKTDLSLNADALMLKETFTDLFAEKPYVLTTIQPEHMFGALWRCRVPKFAECEVHSETIVSVEELVCAALEHRRTLLVTTPSFLEKALANAEFAQLKTSIVGIVTSGSLLSQSLAKRVREALGISPTEIFGSTETGSVAWRRQISGEEWLLFDGVEATSTSEGLISVESDFALARPFVMGDRVEFVAQRRFKLMGRADRNVKILEKYVSLPAVESELVAHPYVAKAHAIASDEPVPRIRAVIELSDEGKEELKKSSYAEITAKIKHETPGIEPFSFPRRIRYLNAFPYNEQGKLVHSSIAAILESRYQEPVSQCESLHAGSFTCELMFIRDAAYFDGHFKEFKILPGVVQLDYVERCIRRCWNPGAFSGKVTRLKFQRPIQPGERIGLEISKLENGSFSFVLKCGDSACTSGILVYAQAEEKPLPAIKKVSAWVLLAGVVGSFLNSALAAMPVSFESALRRALDADASWTMTKTFSDSPVSIKLSGVVSCAKGKGIIWQGEKPFASRIEMTAKEMIFDTPQTQRRASVSELDFYEDIRSAVDEFLAGKEMMFEEIFEVSANENGGSWRVGLTPKRSDMRSIIKSVMLEGSNTVERAVFNYRSGEKAVFQFKETGRGEHALWKESK